jgi:small-conductance mechanosensitive channel
MDVHERHQLDAAARVQKVRARARPWRSILALLLAIAAAIVAEATRVNGLTGLHSASQTHRLIYVCGLAAFFVLGLAAAIGLSARVQSTSKTRIGQAHAGVLRYSLTLVGVFAVLMFSLAIARIDVKELLVSGAVLGVILGIAAQQSLANLFAGLVLLFAHPFRVGSRIGFRAGALGGQMNGLVVDIGLTYVQLETDEGPALMPNVQALAAVILAIPQQSAAQTVTPNGPGTTGTAAGRVSAGTTDHVRQGANPGTSAA